MPAAGTTYSYERLNMLDTRGVAYLALLHK